MDEFWNNEENAMEDYNSDLKGNMIVKLTFKLSIDVVKFIELLKTSEGLL